MKTKELLRVLERLEWSTHADCEGTGFMGSGPPMHPYAHPACPLCGGLNPQQKYPNCFNKSALGHRPGCSLYDAIVTLKGNA